MFKLARHGVYLLSERERSICHVDTDCNVTDDVAGIVTVQVDEAVENIVTDEAAKE